MSRRHLPTPRNRRCRTSRCRMSRRRPRTLRNRRCRTSRRHLRILRRCRYQALPTARSPIRNHPTSRHLPIPGPVLPAQPSLRLMQSQPARLCQPSPWLTACIYLFFSIILLLSRCLQGCLTQCKNGCSMSINRVNSFLCLFCHITVTIIAFAVIFYKIVLKRLRFQLSPATFRKRSTAV